MALIKHVNMRKKAALAFPAVVARLKDIIGQFMDGEDFDDPSLKPKFFLYKNLEHTTDLELRMSIKHTVPHNNTMSTTSMSVHFNYKNTTGITIEQVDSVAALTQLGANYPALLETLFINHKRKEGSLQEAFVTYHTYYGGMSAHIEDAQKFFRKPGTILFFIRHNDCVESFEEIATVIAAQRVDDPLNPWFEPHTTKRFLQFGDNRYPASDDRRKPFLKSAKYSFATYEEFLTVQGFFYIQEGEVTKAQFMGIESHVWPLRLVSIPGARDTKYMGFLEKPDECKTKIAIGDTLDLYFGEIDHVDKWNASIVAPFPFSPLNDICLIISRPWDSSSKQRTALPDGVDLKPVNFRDLTTADAGRNAILNAPSIKFELSAMNSDKTIRRIIFALRDIQRITDPHLSVKQLLLGNDLQSLPRPTSTLPSQLSCATLVASAQAHHSYLIDSHP